MHHVSAKLYGGVCMCDWRGQLGVLVGARTFTAQLRAMWTSKWCDSDTEEEDNDDDDDRHTIVLRPRTMLLCQFVCVCVCKIWSATFCGAFCGRLKKFTQIALSCWTNFSAVVFIEHTQKRMAGQRIVGMSSIKYLHFATLKKKSTGARTLQLFQVFLI